MPEIILIGAGGHCHSCIDVLESEGRFSIAGIVQRPGGGISEKILGYPILGTDEDLPILRQKYSRALITVGQIRNSLLRRRLFNRLIELDFELPVVRSAYSYMSEHVRIGQGTIIMHHALINAGACVGENCIINTKALIEHDVKIGADCHISTGAVVNGGAEIGAGSFFGSNAVAVHNIILPPGSFVRAGNLERGDR